MWEAEIPLKAEPLGYKKLIILFDLHPLPHFCSSYASPKWEKKEFHFSDQNISLYIYPKSYRLSDDVFEHLEFALKYEGLNLYILKEVLLKLPLPDVIDYICQKKNGKYQRIIWYLYEKFTHKKLPLPDLKQGSFVFLLDRKLYYTSSAKRSRRHLIADNLLGTLDFAPIVRKTAKLINYEKKELNLLAGQLTQKYDPSILSRALRYLYTKETMSSWEIEKEKPDNQKLNKFVDLLHRADAIGPLCEETLVELQKDILDKRFVSHSYRDFQNYVGEEPRMGELILHYICPLPKDVRFLMDSLMATFDLMKKSKINPVIIAAVISFAFVYIHPFEDGNGRIHRFLIHYVLAALKFIPEGFVFPISAVIVRHLHQYDKILEVFSKPLLKLITNYKISETGALSILQETCNYYRFIDFTPIAEYLFEIVEKTIMTDFKEELDFLTAYDNIKRCCKAIVDMPDQKMDLFIRCVRQNNGKLSNRKKESYFSMLTDEEIKQMEALIQKYSSSVLQFP